ncbi:MAG TPA: CBS domain-containing protein [Methanomassiliicoccales archaeon]|nr:CBS domain-containing protein [Methanomassiliicoccales archaeon]
MPYILKKFIELTVEEVADNLIVEPSVISLDASIREVIDAMLENPITRKVYVVDIEGKLVGMVTTATILRLIGYRVGVRTGTLSFYKFLRDTLKEEVRSVMEAPVFVKPKNKLTEALLKMLDENMNDIPVVDENMKLLGELNSLELFAKARDLFIEEGDDKPDTVQT